MAECESAEADLPEEVLTGMDPRLGLEVGREGIPFGVMGKMFWMNVSQTKFQRAGAFVPLAAYDAVIRQLFAKADLVSSRIPPSSKHCWSCSESERGCILLGLVSGGYYECW